MQFSGTISIHLLIVTELDIQTKLVQLYIAVQCQNKTYLSISLDTSDSVVLYPRSFSVERKKKKNPISKSPPWRKTSTQQVDIRSAVNQNI